MKATSLPPSLIILPPFALRLCEQGFIENSVHLALPVLSATIARTAVALPLDFVIEEFIYIGIYALSRTKYYKLSALFITLVVNLVVWYLIITLKAFDGAQLLVLVALLAGLLLSIRT